jgi:hypothetical protein
MANKSRPELARGTMHLVALGGRMQAATFSGLTSPVFFY